jgi:hypothetical protein
MTKAKTTKAERAVTLEAWDDDAVQAAGFFGRVPDPTPNANYTASMNDAPTPETDAGWKKQAEARMAELVS